MIEPVTGPLVSVVIPVYNGADYLAECLESVVAQVYTNWECVIVDNASTDETPTIASAFADRDERIRVVTNPQTVPIIANFNAAMRHVSPQAQYAKLLCADDCLLPECLRRKVDVAEQHPTVGIVGSYAQWGDDVGLVGLPYPSEAVPGSVPCRLGFLDEKNVFGSPTCVMFRAEIVRDRVPSFYDEEELHADADVCYDILRHHDYGFVHQILQYVRFHEDSITDTLCAPLFTWKVAKIRQKKKYGRVFLSADEYERCMRDTWRKYYDFLAGELLSLRRDREFWQYHRLALEQAGERLDRSRIVAAVAPRVIRNLLSPRTTIRRFLRRRKERMAGRRQRARSDRVDLETSIDSEQIPG